MSDKEFYWFCRLLRWTTNLSLALIVLILLLIPFAFFMAEEKLWTGFLGFFVFIGWFYMNFKDKTRLMRAERVYRGINGTTGVMFPLWQNVVFWFLYIFMELLMAGIAISVFSKAIWPG
jgi:hypothetical protein